MTKMSTAIIVIVVEAVGWVSERNKEVTVVEAAANLQALTVLVVIILCNQCFLYIWQCVHCIGYSFNHIRRRWQ